MILTDVEFANLKNYCKIDQDYDDDVLKMIINADEIEIARAIKYGSAPNDYVKEPRFKIALMKQVKEDYYQRGLTADAYRPELVSGINGIINQLRGELDSEDN
ncbi:UNVERIFIED_CONTAM: phage gp6-like head-tail connector protein [Limosilactobacillus fermentum]|uniref:Head-tail connector protein n=1 Tax=Limosilactobacillus fermentum TaxID=1613 RepID=A0AAJ5ZYB3_LIMFE|nr:head-tail connector protein [Limosilactobacillus fermentum]MED7634570.1 phage gp6-like head-tail connector protein [Limosilactobacillus fermentum]WFR90205.1 head-tail connector protein [Limosilactobacillus fermentum]